MLTCVMSIQLLYHRCRLWAVLRLIRSSLALMWRFVISLTPCVLGWLRFNRTSVHDCYSGMPELRIGRTTSGCFTVIGGYRLLTTRVCGKTISTDPLRVSYGPSRFVYVKGFLLSLMDV